MKRFVKKNISGQSLFEVVVALAIAGVVLVSIVALTTSSIRNSTFSKNNAQASRYSQEAMEWLRGQRDNDWASFANRSFSGVNTTYCLSSLSWPASDGGCGSTTISGTVFVREVELTTPSLSSINATVRVSWTDSQGTHTVTNQTLFTNWRR